MTFDIKQFIKLNKNNLLITFLSLTTFFVSATLSYTVLSLTNAFFQEGKKESIEEKKQFVKIDASDSYRVLLLGYGGAGHDGGTLSDSVIVANVDPKNKHITLISVPRDLWVEIPVRSDLSENHKINAAYAIGLSDTLFPLKQPQYKGEVGAARLAKEVTEDVVGMPIKYYIAINFDGFKEAIDALGGISVDVPVAFDDYFYPIKGNENETCGISAAKIAEFHAQYSDFQLEKQFECRYEHLHFDQGVQSMDGETALKFVRSRHSAEHGGDFARHLRQQVVLAAVKDKLISLGAIDDAISFFQRLVGSVRTDIDEQVITDIIDTHGDLKAYTVSSVSLSEENTLISTKSLDGQFILIPKEGENVWNGIHSYIQEQISQQEL